MYTVLKRSDILQLSNFLYDGAFMLWAMRRHMCTLQRAFSTFDLLRVLALPSPEGPGWVDVLSDSIMCIFTFSPREFRTRLSSRSPTWLQYVIVASWFHILGSATWLCFNYKNWKQSITIVFQRQPSHISILYQKKLLDTTIRPERKAMKT